MTYRDDDEAVRLRHEAAQRELADLRTKLHALGEVSSRVATLERELQATRARVTLPLLDRLSVASPCKESWAGMSGDERARFCVRCEQKVYDLSAMTRAQAEDLLRAHGTSLCVRFYRRSDGTVMTADCPVGRRRRTLQTAVAGVAAAATVVTAGAASVAALVGGVMMMGSPGYADAQEEVVMGAVAIEDAPPPEADDGALAPPHVAPPEEDVPEGAAEVSPEPGLETDPVRPEVR